MGLNNLPKVHTQPGLEPTTSCIWIIPHRFGNPFSTHTPNLINISRSAAVVSVRLGIERSRVRSPGGAKKWMHVCKYLPLFSCVLCYIMCLIVVSVCTTVNLRHWVSLAPLFGSVYTTVLNCVCYVMFIWWFVLYYMHCPAWQILCNPAFVLQYKKTITIITINAPKRNSKKTLPGSGILLRFQPWYLPFIRWLSYVSLCKIWAKSDNRLEL